MNVAPPPRQKPFATAPVAVGRPGDRERVCVVVVTYNSAAVIGGLLDSLPAGLEGVPESEVIVVDNSSPDGSAEVAAAHRLRPRVVQMGRNAGYAAAINAAGAAAGADAHLLVLNPDLRLLPGAARLLLDRVRTGHAGVALPCNFREDGTVDPTIRREPSVLTAWSDSLLGGRLAARLGLGEIVDGAGCYERADRVSWATGSALMVAPRARRAVGDWDESYFLYSEEVDFQRRVREAGLEIVYVPEAHVMHIGGDYRANPRLYALLTSNRIRYFSRYHDPFSTLFFRLGVAAGEALRMLRGPAHRQALVRALTPLKPALSFRLDKPDTPQA